MGIVSLSPVEIKLDLFVNLFNQPEWTGLSSGASKKLAENRSLPHNTIFRPPIREKYLSNYAVLAQA